MLVCFSSNYLVLCSKVEACGTEEQNDTVVTGYHCSKSQVIICKNLSGQEDAKLTSKQQNKILNTKDE